MRNVWYSSSSLVHPPQILASLKISFKKENWKEPDVLLLKFWRKKKKTCYREAVAIFIYQINTDKKKILGKLALN